MAKFNIYTENDGKSIDLILAHDGDGINLGTVDEEGEIDTYILAITPEGKIKRYCDVDVDGFVTDENGIVAIDDENF